MIPRVQIAIRVLDRATGQCVSELDFTGQTFAAVRLAQKQAQNTTSNLVVISTRKGS